MSANKEGKAGDIKLYRERPLCYVVKIIETPDTEEMWRYNFKILHILDGFESDNIGDEFSASKSKEDGQMAGWHLWDLKESYAKDWIKGIPKEIQESWK